ncbi:hypothetical protein [Enterococcus sp. AZ072]|uniref:hypothetical protein n=1 Tax=unclassified Enterococcus TaxID=2608891 RepID=UPI003D269644
MKNVFKRIGLSLIWVSLAGVMIWRGDYNLALFGLIATMLFLIWVVDMKSITSLSLDWNKKKIEMKKMYEETKKTANEVEVSAKTFNQTITAFMRFNLTDLQTQGTSFNQMPWQEAAKFVTEAMELKKVLHSADIELMVLLEQSAAKILELFMMDAYDFFPNGIEDLKLIEEVMSCGISYGEDGHVIFDRNSLAVDFEGLKNLSTKVTDGKQLQWKKGVDELEDFYKQNF